MNNVSDFVLKDIVQGRLEIDESTNIWKVHLYTEKEADEDIGTYYEFISYDLSKRGRPVQDEADIGTVNELSFTEFVSKIFCEAPKSTTIVFASCVGNCNGLSLAEIETKFEYL